MSAQIRDYRSSEQEVAVALSLRARALVLASLKQVLGAEIFRRLHPDWRAGQETAVRAVLSDRATQVWVAEAASGPAGFVAAKFDSGSLVGEIYTLAVDPPAQGQGIGTALTEVATGLAAYLGDAGGDGRYRR